MSEPGIAASIGEWITLEPGATEDRARFVMGLAEQLTCAGIPLWRLRYALMSMHPEVLWRSVLWSKRDGVSVIDQPHARLGDAFYTASPVAVVRSSGSSLRVRLEPGELPFALCTELREQGGTDFYAMPLPFSNGQVSYATFVTDSPAGFTDSMLALLDGIVPYLARRIELESAYYATRGLLEVYLGKNAARRVLAGEFQRGRGELIEAAIWFSDMRGFTKLSDRLSPARVVELLDAHFELIVGAVSEHGGEVLKFIGDAVLAIFPLASDPRDACRRALAAAARTFEGLARANEGLVSAGEAPTEIGVALHSGAVMYGNVGGRDRLDFTVISSAVNEASRLESMCKSLRTPLALSQRFVEVAELQDVEDLGEQELRGVRAPLRVFTVRF